MLTHITFLSLLSDVSGVDYFRQMLIFVSQSESVSFWGFTPRFCHAYLLPDIIHSTCLVHLHTHTYILQTENMMRWVIINPKTISLSLSLLTAFYFVKIIMMKFGETSSNFLVREAISLLCRCVTIKKKKTLLWLFYADLNAYKFTVWVKRDKP